MLERAKMLLLVLSAIFLLAPTHYEPLKGLDFKKNETVQIKVDNYTISYDLYLRGDSFEEKWFLSQISASSEKLLEFAKSRGYTTQECRPLDNLNIYIVSVDILNDRKRFYKYQGAEDDIIIWALFDQVLDKPNFGVILLTDQQEYNASLFAHELAHYWSYRFCWDFYYNIDGEVMAGDFERFLKEKL